ncbi:MULTISPECIES: hypothetical protein [Nocardia]|uniref:hypothetical protein n=1 Tax=Nocardia TaxID=1817 RepID=UPI001E4E048C|nr:MULTISPECIES: hypothetical protein [Nocardia]
MLSDLGISDGPGRAEPAEDNTAPGYGCRCGRCVEAQWNTQRLKYWLAARLLAFGADEAVVDRRCGPLTVDVWWRRGTEQFAIEVRSGPLTQELAQQHTEQLKALGYAGVLWLCAPGFWVAQLPALGIADLAPESCEYRAESGMFELGSEGLVVPGERPYELREFLREWVAGEVAWGYRDHLRKGWAAVTDWEKHTRTQALLLEQQRQELIQQRTALAVARRAVRDKKQQLDRAHARMERTAAKAREQAEAVAAVGRRIADQERVHRALEDTIRRLHKTIDNWQVVTVFVMLLLATFIAATMLIKP